jgi:prepilin-type processing-associated H-X9-DG protein
VVLTILVLFALIVVMVLPRRREGARMAGCQRNLMQIGMALALYDQTHGALPTVPDLGVGGGGDGPLRALLADLGIPDLTGLSDAAKRPARRPGIDPGPRRVPGFVCASDPNATGGIFPAPISYRATTGDAPDGRDGAFAPGRRIGLRRVEAIDGAGYTAGFSERLVGDGRPEHAAPHNYADAPRPLPDAGCPPAAPDAWRGDAGTSWAECTWRSTLYQHALTPDAAPSCIADDGRAAFMGASSGHVEGVNVLFLDGGVRTVTPQVNPKIWREWARIAEAPRDPTDGEQARPD